MHFLASTMIRLLENVVSTALEVVVQVVIAQVPTSVHAGQDLT